MLSMRLQIVMTTMEMVDALDEEKTGEFIPQDFQIVKLLGRVGMQVHTGAVLALEVLQDSRVCW